MSYDDWTHDDWNGDGSVDFHDFCMEYDIVDNHREENAFNEQCSGGCTSSNDNAAKQQQYCTMSGINPLPYIGLFIIFIISIFISG